MKFKTLLWILGILPLHKCPYCKTKLYEHYADAIGTVNYSCYTKGCKFEETIYIDTVKDTFTK